MATLYLFLADLTLLLHFSYVLFVVVGQVLILLGWGRGWGWPRNLLFRGVHLLCIAIVVLQSWLGVICPLTLLENELREMAGSEVGGYEMTFIGYWVGRILFYEAPMWVFSLCYTLFAIVVVATLYLYPPRRLVGKDRR